MFKIFDDLRAANPNAAASRGNAQIYAAKLLVAIDTLKCAYGKEKSGAMAVRLADTDTVITTRPIEINDKSVAFKMAFSHDCAEPYAVEIITYEDKE